MSPNSELLLLEGAILISDAHYCEQRPELMRLLKGIESGSIPATQLILLGDIFDLLFGPIPETMKRNNSAIESINAIARTMEVVFFEGNHDFRLQGVFENVRIVPIADQPLRARYEDKTLYLAHGDIMTGAGYRFYTFLIRNPLVLTVLRWIDTFGNHFIMNWLDRYLAKKDDCQSFEEFESFVQGRLADSAYMDADYFIEGHYHQNRSFQVRTLTYINPAAFACNQRYFIVQSKAKRELLQEVALAKETGC